jgi:hypothetical protein
MLMQKNIFILCARTSNTLFPCLFNKSKSHFDAQSCCSHSEGFLVVMHSSSITLVLAAWAHDGLGLLHGPMVPQAI